MEAVIFDGKEYVKAAVLAERFKYTQDYLGQLCRAKKVDARLVGRAWYINLDSLNSHKKTRYKVPEKEAVDVVNSHHQSSQNYLSRIDVEPVLKKKTVNIIRNEAGKLTEFAVKYEKDDYSLIPRISRDAVLQNIPVLPAGAEDVSVKSAKESYKITTFKAEPLPEVYLKGVLRVNGLEEATEDKLAQANAINQPEAIEKEQEIRPKLISVTKEPEKMVSLETKKPIKIKLYRNSSTTSTRKDEVGNETKSISLSTEKSPAKILGLNKAPRSLQNRSLQVKEVVEKAVIHQPAHVAEIPFIPYANFKTLVIFLCSLVVAFAVLLPEQNLSIRGDSVVREWNISLDTFHAATSLLISK